VQQTLVVALWLRPILPVHLRLVVEAMTSTSRPWSDIRNRSLAARKLPIGTAQTRYGNPAW